MIIENFRNHTRFLSIDFKIDSLIAEDRSQESGVRSQELGVEYLLPVNFSF
ncbi:MAG: hypothetical protein AAFX80_24305 [Cyanobacteria bacterium J06639_18]